MTSSSTAIATRLLHHHEESDFAASVTLFAEVFGTENFCLPKPAHLRRVLALPHFLALVATAAGGEIVGGLTAYVLHSYYTEKLQAYLYDLAVCPRFHRQGIGRNLVDHLRQYCAEEGFAEVFVQADSEDSEALDFYRATGASREAAVVHFTYALTADVDAS